MKLIIIHSEARKELDSAIGYYEEQKASLGLDFLSEVEQDSTKSQSWRTLQNFEITSLSEYGAGKPCTSRAGMYRAPDFDSTNTLHQLGGCGKVPT